MTDLKELAALIRDKKESLLAGWRKQVRELESAKHLDNPTLTDHMPRLLGELADALETGSLQTIPEAVKGDKVRDSARIHGLQRAEDKFDIEEVVAEYNILRGCIHDLAEEHSFSLQGVPFHIFNRVFDHAIGLALQSYATQRALEVRLEREKYLSFVAHDLQTPLFAISLAGRVLEKLLPANKLDPVSARMLKTMRRSMRQLEGLISQVLQENANLQSAEGDRLERRTFDLWPQVEALVEELAQVAKDSGTGLENEVPDDLVVYADARLLKRILQNLVANAIRFSPQGMVAVGARGTDEGTIECWVRDNGAGIPKARLDVIFEGNDINASEAGRAGLGLSIVRTFVEAHGGKVSAESREGEGSTFRFTLPPKTKGS
ncbi:MAG TPA: sensor histidine kinase [Fibrobacteria bacterium]|nr:sensor histidine kinase [Fibrobacteria bacterium]